MRCKGLIQARICFKTVCTGLPAIRSGTDDASFSRSSLRPANSVPPGVYGPDLSSARFLTATGTPKRADQTPGKPLPGARLLCPCSAIVGARAVKPGTWQRFAGSSVFLLFRVPVAVRNLAEETVVTVDSGRHRVYAGRREDLLKEASSVPDLMAGSPVQTVLKQILACISPLHLTDPSSPYFKPSGCETLHDITRFCHEKSVSAMFSFGSRYGVDARAAKRLMGEVLLDWWVINVGDGFRPGTDIASKESESAISSRYPCLQFGTGYTLSPGQGLLRWT